MSTGEEVAIDRSKWGPGPWDGEPDRWEGEFDGLPALAVRSKLGGNWCGYVAVPPGHPWHGKDGFRDIDAEVHGGITYSNSCSGRICHVPKPGEPDNVWWLGFDCHHSWDFGPGDDHKLRSYETSYKDLRYVQEQCRGLAAQALSAGQVVGKAQVLDPVSK